jgi:hypothetical protein
MADPILRTLKHIINELIAPLGVELARKHPHDWSDVANFIPFESTIKAARESGLSVGDYIDNVMSKTPGATQYTIDGLVSLGVYSGPIQCVVEIGPGSGRYLERILRVCSPSRCEVYETATKWASYVAKEFNVIVQPADGHSLKATPTESADVAQAFKVFSGIPFSKTCRYWPEMVRVTRPNGHIAFDAVTELCLETKIVEAWAESRIDHGSYPALIPRQVVVNYFEERGFRFVGSFLVPMPPGKTETFVFQKLRRESVG